MEGKELKELLLKGEGQCVEFKESLRLLNEIGECISAFSNSNNGVILIGVSDDGKIVGASVGKNTLEELAGFIKRNTDSPVFPRISVERVKGKKVVLVEVNECGEKPVLFKGRGFKRVGKTSQKLSASEIRKLAKESGERVYWDERICRDASLKEIDEEKVKWFLGKAKAERGLAIDEKTPIAQALIQLKLMKNNKITNAAVLLFGKQPERFYLQSEVKCVHFHGIDVEKPFKSFQVYKGDLFKQIDNSLDFVLERMRRPLIPEHGKPTAKRPYEIPRFVIREAIVNAVAHRDYLSTASVQVMVFADRIEVWNPGELPPQLTLGALKKVHPSIPHNPLIAESLYLAKYVEKVGSGTNEMIKQCRKEDLPEPEFQQKMGSFVTIIWRDIYTDEYLDRMGLNEREKRAVKYVKEQGSISNRKHCNLFSVSRKTATNDLGELVNKRIFDTVGTSKRNIRYVLKLRKNYAKITQKLRKKAAQKMPQKGVWNE